MVNGINIDINPQSINDCRHVLPKRHIVMSANVNEKILQEKTCTYTYKINGNGEQPPQFSQIYI